MTDLVNLDDGIILELNADGIIRDANNGEHYGSVPKSLRKLYSTAPKLVESLADAADAFDQVVQWIDDYAIPRLDPEGDGDVDGGNSLSAGLAMKADEIRDLLNSLKYRD